MYRGGRGDYFPGYYRGDPGIFGAIAGAIGRVGGKLIGVGAPEMISMIPGVGTVAKAAMKIGAKIISHPIGSAIASTAVVAGAGHLLSKIPAHQVGVMPGGIPAIPAGMGGPPMAPDPGSARVMRPSGRGYYSRRHLNALAHGLTRARPRMNPFNPHALRRAERRAHSFLRMAARLVRHYVPKAKKGKAYIHTKKR